MDTQANANKTVDRVRDRRCKPLQDAGIPLCMIPVELKSPSKPPRRLLLKVTDSGARVLIFHGLERCSSCVFGFRLPDGINEKAAREAVISFLVRMGFGTDSRSPITPYKIKRRVLSACDELGIKSEAVIVRAPFVPGRTDAGLTAAFFLSAVAAVSGARDPSLSVIFSERFDGMHVQIIMRFDPEDKGVDLRCFDSINVYAERRRAFFLVQKVSYGAIAELCVERLDLSLIGLKAGNVYRGSAKSKKRILP